MGGQRFARQSCFLLFAGVAAFGLWAQINETDDLPLTAGHGIDRPLRTQRPAPSPPPAPHSPPPASPLSLLTPEALSHPLVAHYIGRYSSAEGVAWLDSVVKNGGIYLPFVKEEIARRGLPPELAYLPFIESGYLGTARSRSGAVGMWQFMMNSIGSSMKVNDLIDERRDFRKSTEAALYKLAENYKALGDWPLALAAYNAGLGAINRAARKYPGSDYWLLCAHQELLQETVHYVPKFLAVSYILSQPRRFGVDYWPETVEWATIRPEKQVSLDIIALETGIDRGLLRRLNTELLHGITPADSNYELKIPPEHIPAVAGLLAREDSRLLRYYRYQIKYGDTLSALSRHYGVPLDMIEAYNPGIAARHLKIGETVIIPALKAAEPYAGAGGGAGAGPATGAFRGIHLIAQGDTLWSLAIRYRVDPQVLADENGMELNQILSIGKALKVPIE